MENIFVMDGSADSWEDAIQICTERLIEEGDVKPSFKEACLKREQAFPTGLPTAPGVAIPHAGNEHVYENGICLLRLKHPVLFQRLDVPEETVPVNFVYNLATSESEGHIDILKKLMESIHSGQILKDYMDVPLEQLYDMVYKQLNK